MEKQTKFFTFYQNNSGGSFDIDLSSGISKYVIIEAKNADQANDIALGIGLYFYGCSSGNDCSCCGDRWQEASDDEGTELPSIYGENVVITDSFNERYSIHFLNKNN